MNETEFNESACVIVVCLIALALYIVFVGGLHLLDEQWRFGWRR